MSGESDAQRRARERHESHMANVRAVQRCTQLKRVETVAGSLEFLMGRGVTLTEAQEAQLADLHRQRDELRRELGEAEQ